MNGCGLVADGDRADQSLLLACSIGSVRYNRQAESSLLEFLLVCGLRGFASDHGWRDTDVSVVVAFWGLQWCQV